MRVRKLGEGAVAADRRSVIQMRSRVRVAIRLASKAGQTTDTLQRYYARLRDTRRPVPDLVDIRRHLPFA
jgi:hypothetical protein